MHNPSIGVLDTGVANLYSVCRALTSLGANVESVRTPQELESCSHMVIPGSGAYPYVWQNLHARGLIVAINEFRVSGKPILGICLGMQMMFASSLENDEYNAGLNFFDGSVVPLEKYTRGTKTRNVGWSSLAFSGLCPLFNGVSTTDKFYFMHSCICIPETNNNVIATISGTVDGIAAVGNNNTYGVQFHPETSGKQGLQVFKNFIFL